MRIKFNLTAAHLLFFITLYSSDLLSQSAIDQVRAARELETAGRTDLAMKQYEALFQKYPNNRLVFQYYTKMLIKNQVYQEALDLCDRAVCIEPDYEKEIVRILVLMRMGNLMQAESCVDSMFVRHGQNKDFVHGLASGLIGERLYEDAVDVYQRADANGQEKHPFSWNLASLYITMQQYDAATDALLEYLESHPKQIDMVRIQLENMPKTNTVYQQVVGVLEKRIKSNPDNTDIGTVLYQYYLENKDFDSAFKWIQRQEIQKSPEEWGPLCFSFGQKASLEKEFIVANDAFLRILKMKNPYKEETVLHFLASNFAQQNKWREADQIYKRLMHKFSNSVHQMNYAFESLLVSEVLGLEADSIMIRLQSILKHRRISSELKEAVETRMIYHYNRMGMFEQSDFLLTEQLRQYNITAPEWLASIIERARISYWQGCFKKTKSLLDTLKSSEVVQFWSGQDLMNDGLELYWKTLNLIQQNPDRAKLFVQGEHLFFYKYYAESMSVLDSLLKNSGSLKFAADAWFLKGGVLEKTHQLELSIAAYDSVWEQYPEHRLADQALERTGKLCELLNRKKEAIRRFESLLDAYPRSVYAESVREGLRVLEGS